jgi:hypothetical protein
VRKEILWPCEKMEGEGILRRTLELKFKRMRPVG